MSTGILASHYINDWKNLCDIYAWQQKCLSYMSGTEDACVIAINLN